MQTYIQTYSSSNIYLVQLLSAALLKRALCQYPPNMSIVSSTHKNKQMPAMKCNVEIKIKKTCYNKTEG